MKTRKLQIVLLCLSLFVALASPCQAQNGNTVDQKEWKRRYKVTDLLVVRPLGLLMTLGGSAVFAVTLPFTVISGDVDDAADTLVKEPAKIAFGRR